MGRWVPDMQNTYPVPLSVEMNQNFSNPPLLLLWTLGKIAQYLKITENVAFAFF